MGGVWYGFGKAVGELPFGEVEWFFGSRHVWRQDRWLVMVTGIALSLCNIGGDGPWILVVVGGGPGFGGSEGGAFGQGQVALVADMGGNMTSR